MPDEIVDVGADDGVDGSERSSGGTSSSVLSAWASEEAPASKEEKTEKDTPERADKSEDAPARAAGKGEGDGGKTKPPPPEPAKKEETPPEKRKYKLKAAGEDLEVDEDELVRGYSRNRDYTKKAQALAEERRAFDRARALAKADPGEALKLLGLDPAEYAKHAERLVLKRYSEEFGADGQPLSPEQKELARYRNQEVERQAVTQQQAEEVKQQEMAVARDAQEKHWVKTIVGRLEKGGDPKHILPRVAAALGDAIGRDQGVDPADLIDDAVSLAWDDIRAEHSTLYGSLEGPALLKALGEDTVKKVRRQLVAEFKAGRAQPKPEVQERPEGEEKPGRNRNGTFKNSRDALSSWVQGR